MYNIRSKFEKNSPLPCWKGYERVPGTKKNTPGSCRKASPAKKIKGGGTRKVCLPAAKVRSMSKAERAKFGGKPQQAALAKAAKKDLKRKRNV